MSASPASPAGGLGALRARLALGARPLGHLHLSLRAVEHGRSPRVALAALAASLAVDAAIVRRLADPAYRPGAPQRVAEIVDTALWAAAEASPVTMAGPLTINAQTAAIEAGFRAGAGTRAVPVYDPAAPWPPGGGRAVATRLANALLPVVGPFAAGMVVRRRLGLRVNPTDAVWSLGMGFMGFLTARHRDRAQARSRSEWESLTQARVTDGARAAVADLVTRSSPAHDFKKTLLVLGDAGSAPAAAAARRHAARPAELVADGADGRALGRVVRAVTIEPRDAGRLWLSTAQAARVERFARDALASTPDGARPVLRVDAADPTRLSLSLLDARLVVEHDPPSYRARLYPTATVFALSAALRAGDLLPPFRTLPPAAVAVGVAADLAAATRFWRRPPTDQDLPLALALSSVGTVAGLVAAASSRASTRGRDGSAHLAGLSAVHGATMVLATHWGRLSGAQRALLPGTVLALAAASRARFRPPAITWLESATVLAQSVASAWRITDLVDAESAVLQGDLHRDYAVRCEEAVRAAVAAELDRFAEELRTAETALEEIGAELDDRTRSAIEGDCRELREWIAGMRSGTGASTS